MVDSLKEKLYKDIKEYGLQSLQTYNTSLRIAFELENIYNKNKTISSYYNQSIDALIEYIKNSEINPSEARWNQYAIKYGYLSSQSMGYLDGIGFNKLCKRIRKELET